MNWFMNRSVRTKQIGALGPVLTLPFFLAVFALLKLAALHATTVEMSDRSVPAMQALSELQSGLMRSRSSELSYVFLKDSGERALQSANMDAGMSQATKAEAELEPLMGNADEKMVFVAIQQDVERCQAETKAILGYTAKNDNAGAMSAALGSAAAAFSQSMSDVQKEIDVKAQGAAEAKKASAAIYLWSFWWILGTLVVATALSLLLAIATTRSIAGPVHEAAEVVRRIAAGDITSGELSVRNADEIGQLAYNINIMQRNLRGMIASVFTSAEQIAIASDEFSSANRQITAHSAGVFEQANVVSSTTENLKHNLQSVATGTQQMSATIQEIAKNASESARVAGEAVKTAQNTNEAISKLGDSSAQIGQVVKVITSIAEQTNLLALNATIEAARAGEAGKGFAVVANEVKELAKQTAKATEDISQKIAAIQSDTRESVSAIAAIGGIIGHINDITTTIATAVEQQSATASEMSRNLSEAANGSTEIAGHIEGVAQAAQGTSAGASDAQQGAEMLAEMSTGLHGLVSQFKINSSKSGGSQTVN